MFRIVRFLMLIGALSGLLAQAQARTWLPQPAPAALMEKSMPECDDMPGIERPSDLFGEAAQTEAQERDPCDSLLACIALNGWVVSVLVAEPASFVPAGPEPVVPSVTRHRTILPYALIRATDEPPRA